MAQPSKFVPKMAMPLDAKLFSIVGMEQSSGIAEYEVTLLPPFPSDATIHDVACGLGAVTKSIIASSPPSTIKIEATDVAPYMIALYNKSAEANNWPSKATLMNAQDLTYPDNTFSHVFLSFGLPILPDAVKAVKEMYRTLKPGGTFVTAFWLQIPQGEVAQDTRRAIWGADAKLAMEPHPQHKDREYQRSLLVAGGFKFEDIELYEKISPLVVKNLDEFALAIWSAVGQPLGGWTADDDDKWDLAVKTYKELLTKKPGFGVDADGNVVLECIAQVVIAHKPAA